MCLPCARHDAIQNKTVFEGAERLQLPNEAAAVLLKVEQFLQRQRSKLEKAMKNHSELQNRNDGCDMTPEAQRMGLKQKLKGMHIYLLMLRHRGTLVLRVWTRIKHCTAAGR